MIEVAWIKRQSHQVGISLDVREPGLVEIIGLSAGKKQASGNTARKEERSGSSAYFMLSLLRWNIVCIVEQILDSGWSAGCHHISSKGFRSQEHQLMFRVTVPWWCSINCVLMEAMDFTIFRRGHAAYYRHTHSCRSRLA